MIKLSDNACCNECLSGQLGELDRDYGQGHFKCNNLSNDHLDAVKAGAWVEYEDGEWVLYAVDKAHRE